LAPGTPCILVSQIQKTAVDLLPFCAGSGLILVACSSGAQLSNYATFLAEPAFAPLSIVMTALSTAAAVVVTPLLTLLLLGRRLHIDLVGMIRNITEIVVAPIAAGLFLNRFAPSISRMIRPSLPFLSVLVTSCCIGSPLAVNIDAIRSPLGLLILAPVLGFHTAAFVAGYKLTEVTWPNTPDLRGLARTMSFETGMQSSLLGLALANNFFEDPLVGLPPAVSVVTMSLMAFGLVTYWNSKQ
jgi:predicted Na+-dependent transporter